MFKLEKVFQNDDKFFIYFELFIKSLIIYFVSYTFCILEKNTIYDIKEFDIFLNSNYFQFTIFLSIIFFFLNFVTSKNLRFFEKKNKINLKEIQNFFISIVLTLFILNFQNYQIIISNNFVILIFLLFFFILLSNLIVIFIYNYLINSNIIQRNILLVGYLNDVLKILKEKSNIINIYKGCIIVDLQNQNKKIIRNQIKIPIFDLNEDVRSILEYHHLGQIWILDNSYSIEKIENLINHVIKFSVDILIIKLNKISINNKEYLINDKYEYVNYQISRFYGLNFFIKIILDKILSIFFITILSPFIVTSLILIYLEDGFPLIFSQDRTGWDGRRFKIFKLRTLKNDKFDKTEQVTKNDKRLLNVGKFIRKYSLDEVPQFFNVLLGDMSIVGPRPHMVEHDIYYSKFFKEFLKRNKTSPGLTGWAQINGLRGATPNIENMKKRMEYDLWYLDNWTPILDLIIIFKTFYIVFKYKGD